MEKKKELLFSVTRKDFVIEPYKGSGSGGQHRNKTMSCIRIRHPESGAEAIATENREQGRNKKLAFKRIVDSKKFRSWIKIRSSETAQSQKELKKKIDDIVDKSMESDNLLVETYDVEEEKWIKEEAKQDL